MPPAPQAQEHLRSLQRSQQEATQRGQTASQQLSSFERSLNQVRGGDLADVNFQDSALNATISDYNRNVQEAQRPYHTTTEYQSAVYGSYRMGERGGRRFLNEARQQISTDLLKIQNQARAQRADALETYRRSKIEEQRQARRDAAAFGQQAYQVEEREEQKRIARNERYRQDFEQQLLAGKPLGAEFIAQFAESSGEKAEDIQKLVEQAGGAALSALKEAANKQGILIDEQDIDYSSNESAIRSIRDQMEYSRAQELARKRREEQRKETKLDLDIAGHRLDIEEFEHDKTVDARKLKQGDVRTAIQAARLELDRLRFKEYQSRGRGGANLSREERDRIRAGDTAEAYLSQIAPEDADNRNIQLVALGVADANVGGRIRNEKAFTRAVDQAITEIDAQDGQYIPLIVQKYAPYSAELENLKLDIEAGGLTQDDTRRRFLDVAQNVFGDKDNPELNYTKLARELISELEVSGTPGPDVQPENYEGHPGHQGARGTTPLIYPPLKKRDNYISPFSEYKDRYGTGLGDSDGETSTTEVEIEDIPNSQQVIDDAYHRYFGDDLY